MKSKHSAKPSHRMAKGSAFGGSSPRRRCSLQGGISVSGGAGMDTLGKMMQKGSMAYGKAASNRGPSFP